MRWWWENVRKFRVRKREVEKERKWVVFCLFFILRTTWIKIVFFFANFIALENSFSSHQKKTIEKNHKMTMMKGKIDEET